MAQNKHVVIYTDGACSGNPGPGGFGIILQYGEHRKEISKGFPNTTNNRMELLGVITALEALKTPCTVDLYSDSKYVIDAIQKGWAVKGHAQNENNNRCDELAVAEWKKIKDNL